MSMSKSKAIMKMAVSAATTGALKHAILYPETRTVRLVELDLNLQFTDYSDSLLNDFLSTLEMNNIQIVGWRGVFDPKIGSQVRKYNVYCDLEFSIMVPGPHEDVTPKQVNDAIEEIDDALRNLDCYEEIKVSIRDVEIE